MARVHGEFHWIGFRICYRKTLYIFDATKIMVSLNQSIEKKHAALWVFWALAQSQRCRTRGGWVPVWGAWTLETHARLEPLGNCIRQSPDILPNNQRLMSPRGEKLHGFDLIRSSPVGSSVNWSTIYIQNNYRDDHKWKQDLLWYKYWILFINDINIGDILFLSNRIHLDVA